MILSDLLFEKDRLTAGMYAASTRRSYTQGWNRFIKWCEAEELPSLPATENTISLWVTSLLMDGLKTTTVAAWIAGIIHYHRESRQPSPCGPSVRRIITGARRLRREQPEGKRAISVLELWKISRLMNPKTAAGARNRALMVLGFAGAFRRSELSGLDLRDVQFVPKGLMVTLRWSKTDQTGEGRLVGIFRGDNPDTCPVRILQWWIDFRGNQPGPLFPSITAGGSILYSHRLMGDGVVQVIKRGVRSIGLDPHFYAGHSLRAGFVTAAALNGATEMAVMARTGHKTSRMLHRYFRPVAAFAVNPLAGKL
jgi:integrase